jgi:hypothetical protein
LSQGKQTARELNVVSMAAFAVVMPVSLLASSQVTNKVTGGKIAAGEAKIAAGKEKIASGEAQLKAGKLELSRGIERLNQANVIRIACGIAAIFFTILWLSLALYWRKPLLALFKGKHK